MASWLFFVARECGSSSQHFRIDCTALPKFSRSPTTSLSRRLSNQSAQHHPHTALPRTPTSTPSPSPALSPPSQRNTIPPPHSSTAHTNFYPLPPGRHHYHQLLLPAASAAPALLAHVLSRRIVATDSAYLFAAPSAKTLSSRRRPLALPTSGAYGPSR